MPWSHLDARSFISGGRDRRWRRLAFVLTVRPALCPIIITADRVFSSLRLFLPLATDQAFSSSFYYFFLLLIGSSLFDNRVAKSTSFCPRFWFLKLILKRIRWKKTQLPCQYDTYYAISLQFINCFNISLFAY